MRARIRRSIYAAPLDKDVSPDEIRDDLCLLVNGYVKRMHPGAQDLANAPLHTTSIGDRQTSTYK